jgi:hypothetical protein
MPWARASVPPPAPAAAACDAPTTDEALAAANARLADDVRACQRRLGDVEARVVDDPPAMPSSSDDTLDLTVSSEPAPTPEPTDPQPDPTPAEWRQMAESGTFSYRTVCEGAAEHAHADDLVQRLGLSPADSDVVASAFSASRERVWAAVKPACMRLLGVNDPGAEVLGEQRCMEATMAFEDRSGAGATSALRTVAEVRAGDRAEPRADDDVDPVARMMLAVTSEGTRIQADLARTLGPDEAKRIYEQWDCWTGGGWAEGGGEVE